MYNYAVFFFYEDYMQGTYLSKHYLYSKIALNFLNQHLDENELAVLKTLYFSDNGSWN